MRKFKFIPVGLLLLVLVPVLLISLTQSPKKNSPLSIKLDSVNITSSDSLVNISLLPKHDTIFYLNKRKILIKVCGKRENKGTFLILHGWNLPPEDWCTKTSLCKKVTAEGYCMILPDMGKSEYQKRIFPETRIDWRSTPTRKWLTDTLVPFLHKNFALLLENEDNFIVGLSTGARGVALIALDLPKLFKGAAALSGDYDQTKIPNDKITTGFYGSYKKQRERWEKIDNAISQIKEFSTPIYLGHGRLDKVVPSQQTKLFYDSLVKYHPNLKVKLNMPNAGHDYKYWGSEVDNILAFFKELNSN